MFKHFEIFGILAVLNNEKMGKKCKHFEIFGIFCLKHFEIFGIFCLKHFEIFGKTIKFA